VTILAGEDTSENKEKTVGAGLLTERPIQYADEDTSLFKIFQFTVGALRAAPN
jgi:hypothetical protein